MMKYPSRAARSLTLGLAALVVVTLCARELCSSENDDQETARLVADMIPRFHFAKAPLDDRISGRLVEGYVKELDPQKLYFLQSDIDEFNRYRSALDDAVKEGNVDFAYLVFDKFKERATRQCAVAHKLIDSEHDFTNGDEWVIDPDDRAWAASTAELDDRWRLWIKRELLQFRLEDKPVAEARENLHKRYRNIKLMRIDQPSRVDTLELYLTELAQCFDPHSSYMSPNSWDDFNIQFRLSLDGIGAELRADDGYTIVNRVVPGGAADKDGRLKINDKIVGVGQETGDIVDIYEMKLSDVVRLIRGERGTKVRLRVQPAAGGETQVYDMTRQKIELNEQAVRGEIINTQDRVGRSGKVGVIHVPSFYRDFEGASAGNGNFRSAQADVARVLAEFEQQGGVDAVVIDLSYNGGGALAEAIEMSGHFIDQGPVVQVKDERGQIKSLDDEDPAVLYRGPLVVVCNRLSASASEIFAGVIKDYRRGLVIGDTTTHGKGTVQNLMDVAPNQMFRIFRPVERGKLKLTIQQFYRVNGDSTQNRGVRSDVVLPNPRLLDHLDLGESFLENPLPFDQIPRARFSAGVLVSSDVVALLQKNSEQRIAADPEFVKVNQSIERFLERKNRKTISLNEEQARKDRAQEQADAEAADPTAEDDDPTPKPDAPIFPKNAYTNEILNVTLDYAGAVKGQLSASRTSP